MKCSIAILAGGQSRRLGQDKALISIHGDGRPLIAHQIEQLHQFSDDLFIVAPDRPGYRALDARLELDDYPGAGPLGGIATALRRAYHEHVLVVACDLPFLCGPLIRWMMEQDRSRAAIVPCIPGRSRQGARLVRQSTHAIYARSSLAVIEIALERELRQISQLLVDMAPLNLPVEQLVRFDPGLRSFFSVNTPEERELAAKWLQTMSHVPPKEIHTIY